MSNNVIVLGGGMVGSAMALDMAKNHQVTLADRSQDVLNKVQSKNSEISITPLDVTNKQDLINTITPFE